MKWRLLFLTICACCFLWGLKGQSDTSTIFPKTKHRFAQMGLGLYYGYTPSWEAPLNQPLGGQEQFSFAPQSSAALNISGLHFWGKVDFWINIPIGQTTHPASQNYNFSRGVETGMKYFLLGNPYDSPISPFVGISFNKIAFQYLGENRSELDRGIELSHSRYPIHAGVAKIFNQKHYLELSATYFYDNDIDYFFSREAGRSLGIPPLHLNLGYRYIFDTTISAEPDYLSGRTDEIFRSMKKNKKLNSFSIGLGPSAAYFTKENNFNQEVSPFLGQPNAVDTYLDLGLGYYFYEPDAHLNLAYRNINKTVAAYGQEQSFNRRALSLDMFKFLFDYKGFVPFLGISPSYERLQVRVSEQEGGVLVDESAELLRMGIVFGWDIRPNNIQSMILRTNLRYYPGLHVDSGNYRFHFNQLEFNFIQVVFYLNRML
jgi:hypothetical protein